MNEQELGKKIAKLLDLGTTENIKQSTLYRLQSARRAALENHYSTLEVMHSGNGTSIFGIHIPYFYSGKLLLLLLVILFIFTMVPANYWQFLDRGKLSHTTVLIDDLPNEGASDDEHELIEEYLDNMLELMDDLSTNAQIDAAPEVQDGISAEIPPIMNKQPEVTSDTPVENAIESITEPIENPLIDIRKDNEIDE